MKKATINEFWRVAPEGHTVLTCEPGDKVTGRLAERAIAAGVATADPDPVETKVEPALETKPAAPVKRKRGRPRKTDK